MAVWVAVLTVYLSVVMRDTNVGIFPYWLIFWWEISNLLKRHKIWCSSYRPHTMNRFKPLSVTQEGRFYFGSWYGYKWYICKLYACNFATGNMIFFSVRLNHYTADYETVVYYNTDLNIFTGNLGRVDLISEYEYDLFIRPDTCNPRFRLWFNFIVDNIRIDQVSGSLSSYCDRITWSVHI